MVKPLPAHTQASLGNMLDKSLTTTTAQRPRPFCHRFCILLNKNYAHLATVCSGHYSPRLWPGELLRLFAERSMVGDGRLTFKEFVALMETGYM